jgi:hypothetical protein
LGKGIYINSLSLRERARVRESKKDLIRMKRIPISVRSDAKEVNPIGTPLTPTLSRRERERNLNDG